MSKPNSGPTNRNFGLSGQNGKGSASRIADIKKFRENHDAIDWSSKRKGRTLQELHDEWEFRHGL